MHVVNRVRSKTKVLVLLLVRLPVGISCPRLLQQRDKRTGSEQLLRLVPPQPLPAAGAVSAAHGGHQQPRPLPVLRHERAVLPALPRHEHALPSGLAALPVLLPELVAGPAGVEQPAAAGGSRWPPREPQQQDHQHREPPSEGQAARGLAGLGHAPQLMLLSGHVSPSGQRLKGRNSKNIYTRFLQKTPRLQCVYMADLLLRSLYIQFVKFKPTRSLKNLLGVDLGGAASVIII